MQRKGLFLALSMVLSLFSLDAAQAQGDTPAAGTDSASGQSAAAPKEGRKRRLGKRLGNLKNRLHRKKNGEASNSTAAPAANPPAQN
ncbi:MAG: hypothetical protein K2X27_15810 [Candidatus Obscuribacterales bacterium]|nr:hypothetical protein [Candidatus Obscuribacterales bacterium]